MNHDFSKEASLRDRSPNVQRLHARMTWLALMLRDGRGFLLGRAPSAADLSAYHTIWFARKNGGPEAEAALPLGPLLGWMDRVAALGHGVRRDMPAAEALDIARASEPRDPGLPADGDPSGLRDGQDVVVQADDSGRDPIRGTLMATDPWEVVMHRDDHVGVVRVHFPRASFDVQSA